MKLKLTALTLVVLVGCTTSLRLPSEIKFGWMSVEPSYTVLRFSGPDRHLRVSFSKEPDSILWEGTEYEVVATVLKDDAVQSLGIRPFYTWVLTSHIISDGVTNVAPHILVVDGRELPLRETIQELARMDSRFKIEKHKPRNAEQAP